MIDNHFLQQIGQIYAGSSVTPEYQAVQFNGFVHGLNTNIPSSQIAQTECAALINFKINRGGQLETRSPFTRYTSVATTSNSKVKTFTQVPIGGTSYELIVDENKKLYYNNAGTPTLIGTLVSNNVEILAYNNVAVILDGAYIKYLDDVSEIKIAYDDGTNASGYQFNNLSGEDDSTLPVGNGTNTRLAYKFTSQIWDTGYTIPMTTIVAKLSRVGDGYTGTDNVDIVVKIRAVSGDAVLATRTLVEAPLATNVSTTATNYTTTFVSGDITNEMALNVAYYATIEYANGDSTNYIKLHCSDVASGGVAYHYTGSYTNDATQDPIMSLRPGKPPKGSFGAVVDLRLFVAGDPDNPGYVWFSNLTHLDWSTTDGGGYIGAVDESNSNFGVGAVVNLYGDLFVYGKKDQPYLCRLSGTSPTDYTLPLTFQRVWSSHKTARSVINDIFYAAVDGVNSLSGVQEYGDLRTFPISDPVYDRIRNYWGTSDLEFAEYYAEDGQYWLCMPDYHRILITHIKNKTMETSGIGTRYPWTEYEFYLHELTSSAYKWTLKSGETDIYRLEIAAGGDPGFDVEPDAITLDGQRTTNQAVIGNLEDHQWFYGDDDSLGYDTVYFKDATGDPDTTEVDLRTVFIPTCFSNFGGAFYMGGSDGYIYKLDSSEYKDRTSIQIKPKWASAYIEIPFAYACLRQLQLIGSSKGGASVDVRIYKDGAEAVDTLTITMGIYDGLTVDEALMDVDDALFLVDDTSTPKFKNLNVNARSFQLMLHNVVLTGWPLYINGFLVKYRRLST